MNCWCYVLSRHFCSLSFSLCFVLLLLCSVHTANSISQLLLVVFRLLVQLSLSRFSIISSIVQNNVIFIVVNQLEYYSPTLNNILMPLYLLFINRLFIQIFKCSIIIICIRTNWFAASAERTLQIEYKLCMCDFV